MSIAATSLPVGAEVERRFAADPGAVDRFLAVAAGYLVAEAHHRRAPVAYTRTTYLDTDDLALLGAESGPLSHRLRIREYGAAPTPRVTPVLQPTGYLELKRSRGSRRDKLRWAAPRDRLWALVEEGGAGGGARPGPPHRAIRDLLGAATLAPRLTTWYRRRSYRGRGIRVTLDEGILFCWPLDPAGAIRLVVPPRPAGRVSHRLIEVKYRGARPSWLREATLDLVPCAESKYQRGMAALGVAPAAVAARIAG